ncbi:MAG: PLP-dependent aspartate aminotransferase family protein [Candidatus Thermoplasmatota archaeon]|nr:PLP-dependent aspartate aminotransferase family protein [Candidatus Thermoplasmatota archaeon]
MKFETKAIHIGQEPDPTTGSIIPPIYQTTTYVLEEIGKDKGFDYTRSSNPTRLALEKNLAALENGKYTVSFSSGMAAISALMNLINPNEHVIVSDDVYGGTYRLFEQVLRKYEFDFTYVDSTNENNVKEAIKDNTKMVWIESPTNPLLKISDIKKIGKITKKHNILLVVDSTFLTPYFFRPLELGADIVIQSTTKYISGHNNIIGGAIITSIKAIYEKMKFIQKAVGAVSSPFDCWLTLLGIKTLAIRMEKHNSNGIRVAEFLSSNKKIRRVIYPGLKSHPGHKIAKDQMTGFGGMISFELNGGIETGIKLMNNVRLCSLAESLGATETMITHPTSMTHSDIPRDVRLKIGITDSLVRLSVGLEHVNDIIDDLKQALNKI